MMSSEPTHFISAMTTSLRNGAMNDAQSVMSP